MTITYGKVETGLTNVRERLGPILDERGSTVIADAMRMLSRTKRQHRESTRQGRKERPVRPWGFRIEASEPLRFRDTQVDRVRLQPDLFIRCFWATDPAEEPAELSVVIRVWCLDENVYFREKWDAQEIRNEIQPDRGRVMLRIHFDLANKNQPGPRYHMQVGGRAHEGEMHWFPEGLAVPRMPHMPLDLVLAAELVAATFYKEQYDDIAREPSWKGARRASEEHLLKAYLERVDAALRNGDSVLGALWNDPWK